jgi:preprotein translocase subunit YajC
MLTTIALGTAPVVLAGQGTDATGGIVGFLLPLVLIFGVFYLFIYRPQKKREQEHEEMVANLEKGDKVVTIGGIHGTVQRIDDDSILAQVDSSGTKLRFDKQAISSVNPDKKKDD